MAEVITLQGENLIAEKMGSHEILDIDTFILSYDPDIDPSSPIDRESGLPDSEQIVYQYSVTQTGYVNPNQVVYSLFMDSTVGPFEFNRMDLVASQDGEINVAIATMPTQNKVADNPGEGIRGQSMTRNFMTVYDGAQEVTDITVEAETWQIGFMARLNARGVPVSGVRCFRSSMRLALIKPDRERGMWKEFALSARLILNLIQAHFLKKYGSIYQDRETLMG